MRLRTKLFLTWAGVLLVLWAGTGWSVRRAVQSSFDRVAAESFAGTRRDLYSLQAERVRGMRQAAAMVMNIPELRALIAEHNFEVSSENLASLQERLDNLADVVGVGFVCVLDARGNVIAQNHASPWKSWGQLRDYLGTSPQASAMVNAVFRTAPSAGKSPSVNAFGIWSFDHHLLQVVGVPLVFCADAGGPPAADGALLMATALTDDLAANLAQSHDCQVSFISGSDLVACSLPPRLREQLQSSRTLSAWPTNASFDVALDGVSYRSSLDPLVDPCSQTPVGAMLIQSDLNEARSAHQTVSAWLLWSMAGGLAAAALASFLVSSAVTRPVRALAQGVRRLGNADTDVNIVVRSRDELGELSVAFNDMVRQIRSRRELERLVEESRALSQAKSQFLANMSHEIRTPLNGVIGMAELLLRTELNDRQEKYAAMVKSSAEVLTALINDILDFSKIEAGKLELESIEFDLREVTEDAVELLALKGMSKGLEVAADISPQIAETFRGDPTRLRQVIVNLLNNAIKFTERGEVVVSVRPAAASGQEKPQILVEVSDTGIGIPRDRMDRLFQSFSQVDTSTTRRFGGTGLGLAICKQLIELMGGTIGVRSEEGRGSTFWFTVPLEAAAPPAAPPSPRDLQPLRALLIDPSPTQRRIVTSILSPIGVTCDVCATAANAAAQLSNADAEKQDFQLLIVDHAVLESQQAELMAYLRQRRAPIPVLGMVPLGSEPERAAYGGSISGYVTKPTRRKPLIDAVLAAVRNAGGPVQAPVQRPLAAPSAGPRAKILLAEDNEINQEVAMELLRTAGYHCDLVSDGRAAVEAFENGKYDLILMDCQMPRMDGFAATRLIREKEAARNNGHPGMNKIPIIALTANAGAEDHQRCTSAGMDGYVAKPFEVDHLLQTIAAALGTRADDDTTTPPEAPFNGQSPLPAAAAAAPAFEIQGILKRCSDSETLVLSILGKFEKQAEQLIAEFTNRMAEGNLAEVARLAHRLKGTAGILAANDLAATAAHLETLSRADDLTAAGRQLELLNLEIQRCVKCAVTTRNQLAGSQAATGPGRAS